MSMISNQVKELRTAAREYRESQTGDYVIPPILEQAADTIESLSAKLDVANKEQSESDGGWIPCSERLPEIIGRHLVTSVWKDGNFETSRVYDAVWGSDGQWHVENYEPAPYEVIAWHPLPEPYREPSQASDLPQDMPWRVHFAQRFGRVE